MGKQKIRFQAKSQKRARIERVQTFGRPKLEALGILLNLNQPNDAGIELNGSI